MIDLTKPVFILATLQGGRLAILGGSNDAAKAREAAAPLPSVTLLRAVPDVAAEHAALLGFTAGLDPAGATYARAQELRRRVRATALELLELTSDLAPSDPAPAGEPGLQTLPPAVAEILAEMLAYEREAFEQDTPVDLADLCTAFGRWRAELKNAIGQPLAGVETSYDLHPQEFARSKLAGYSVEPNGFSAGGWSARDPEGDEIVPLTVAGDLFPTEREAWEACDHHRMFNAR